MLSFFLFNLWFFFFQERFGLTLLVCWNKMSSLFVKVLWGRLGRLEWPPSPHPRQSPSVSLKQSSQTQLFAYKMKASVFAFGVLECQKAQRYRRNLKQMLDLTHNKCVSQYWLKYQSRAQNIMSFNRFLLFVWRWLWCVRPLAHVGVPTFCRLPYPQCISSRIRKQSGSEWYVLRATPTDLVLRSLFSALLSLQLKTF